MEKQTLMDLCYKYLPKGQRLFDSHDVGLEWAEGWNAYNNRVRQALGAVKVIVSSDFKITTVPQDTSQERGVIKIFS